jgi:hypothetical protein
LRAVMRSKEALCSPSDVSRLLLGAFGRLGLVLSRDQKSITALFNHPKSFLLLSFYAFDGGLTKSLASI